MAVAFDAAGTAQQGATGTTASIPITLGTGANRAVVVHWLGQIDTAGIAANIVGGETLAIVAGSDGGLSTQTVILATTTTLTGAITVSVSWTTTQPFVTNALSFTGAASFNNGTFGSTGSLTVTSVNGDLTTTIMDADGSTLTTNQTLRWGPILQSGVNNAGDTGPGTGTTTHTWTAAGSTFRLGSGANIVQAVAASTYGSATPDPGRHLPLLGRFS